MMLFNPILETFVGRVIPTHKPKANTCSKFDGFRRKLCIGHQMKSAEIFVSGRSAQVRPTAENIHRNFDVTFKSFLLMKLAFNIGLHLVFTSHNVNFMGNKCSLSRDIEFRFVTFSGIDGAYELFEWISPWTQLIQGLFQTVRSGEMMAVLP